MKLAARLGPALCVLFLLPGCATFAYRAAPPVSAPSGSVRYLENVPPIAQRTYQCGPAALSSVIHYWGQEEDADSIARAIQAPGARGALNFTLSSHARTLGFWTYLIEAKRGSEGLEELKGWIRKSVPLLVMVRTGFFWAPSYHFVVLKGFNDIEQIFYANIGRPETYAMTYGTVVSRWNGAGSWGLVVCPPERVDWDLDASRAADLAFFCEKRGLLDLAEKWYERAIQKNPGDLILRFNLANVYLKTARRAQAKAIYAELSEKKPAWGAPRNNLAWIYLQEGRAKEAVEVIEAAFRNGAERQADILDTLETARRALHRQTTGTV